MKLLPFLLFLLFSSCKEDSGVGETPDVLRLQNIRVGTVDLKAGATVAKIPIDKNIVISFSNTLDKSSVESNIKLIDAEQNPINLEFAYLDNEATASISTSEVLKRNVNYTLEVGLVKSIAGEEFPGAIYQFTTEQGTFNLISATIDETDLKSPINIQNISTTPQIDLKFSAPLNEGEGLENFFLVTSRSGAKLPLVFDLSDDKTNLKITTSAAAKFLDRYTFSITEALQSTTDLTFSGLSEEFYTQLDSTYKFTEITDEELLTKVQEQTFKYFWDFGHPNSGLARERNTSGDLVTIGGSGFGVMAILVGIERGFITKAEGIERLATIVNFLESADRFHGVWPHWMNGNSGATIPFSANDNGADLVETAFMIQGLLAVRQYLNPAVQEENTIITKITALWEAVEWSWFQQEGENVLTWHWSPNFGFEKNLKIRGWNEALIIYTLAAASPTFPINKTVYENGWAQNGAMVNGNETYGITMPLGSNRGGPLFFAHYSFLGLDPRNLEDQYANYMDQNVAHSSINRAYCIDNPQNYVGYGANAWGLTASDGNSGYSAHDPGNDRGVITPTAAISSIPYTPEESMAAIKHFYYLMGDKLWGEYGFYDAYNVTEGWYADSYLAIDQGPIIIMIENHRTGLLWDLFMADTEITAGLDKLGFSY